MNTHEDTIRTSNNNISDNTNISKSIPPVGSTVNINTSSLLNNNQNMVLLVCPDNTVNKETHLTFTLVSQLCITGIIIYFLLHTEQ